MNAASWKKAADFVAQQATATATATATADSQQLDVLPLSQLSVDDSSPPQVNYGTENPLAASTPRASSISHPITANTTKTSLGYEIT